MSQARPAPSDPTLRLLPEDLLYAPMDGAKIAGVDRQATAEKWNAVGATWPAFACPLAAQQAVMTFEFLKSLLDELVGKCAARDVVAATEKHIDKILPLVVGEIRASTRLIVPATKKDVGEAAQLLKDLARSYAARCPEDCRQGGAINIEKLMQPYKDALEAAERREADPSAEPRFEAWLFCADGDNRYFSIP